MPKWIIVLVIIVVIVLLAGAGGGWWWFKKYHHPAAQAKTTTTTHTNVVPTPQSSSNAVQQYVSNGRDLNLSFTYPASWTVTPSSNNNTKDQPITVTSPTTTIPTGTTSETGKVVVSIRPGSAEATELASGNATIAHDSTQFAYTKPTAAQHQYPYLTYAHLAGGQNPSNVFEEVIVTGITQFTKGQPITTVSIGGLDPIISAAFYKCATQACTSSSATPLSITYDTWQTADIFKQVQSLFASLQLN
jgi:flagellar basal body-associated protein FliL